MISITSSMFGAASLGKIEPNCFFKNAVLKDSLYHSKISSWPPAMIATALGVGE
jgi:hypothetical protein